VFGERQTLSRPAPSSGIDRHTGSSPRVAAGAAGGAIAVWRELDGGKRRIFASAGPAGGALGAATALSAPGRHAGAPRVGIDRAGDAVALWRRRSDGDGKPVVQAAIRPIGAAFGPALDLSEGGRFALALQLAVAPTGDAVAVWRRFDGGHWRVQAASAALHSRG
jgi:hypothetical protein